MKNTAYFIFFLSFTLLISNCTQSTMDYSSAENIDIKWELISNFIEVEDAFEAKFILNNTSDLELGNNWSLFFNVNARPIIDPPSPQAGVVQHINGDWFKLVPNADFSLKPGKSIEILYRGSEGVIKECDGPLGTYFVFYDEDGAQKQIVEVACAIQPFTLPEQINRNKGDQEPIPTPEYRYQNNQGLSQVSNDHVLKIIPSPVQLKSLGGTTQIDASWEISHEEGLESEASYLAEKLQFLSGSTFKTTTNSTAAQQIVLKTGKIVVTGIAKEAYHLDVKSGTIQIVGSDAAGVFYGVQSLLGLAPLSAHQVPSKSIEFEQVSIQDAPRFGHRGLHTDICRNFQNVETLKRMLDIISYYKINKFLFYTTEDEGWRLEIPGLPELTDIGGQRKHTESMHDNVLHPAYGSGPFAYGDGSNGSGYISRAQFIDILKYAKTRHIQVIPELNFPAHARCAIKPMEVRYERLMAEGKEKEANEYRLIDPDDKSVYYSAQMYQDNVVDIANASTYHFYKKVMDEISLMYQEAGLELKDIHAGGDEVPEGAWSASPLAAEVMKDNPDIKDPKNLQAYFVERLLETLKDDTYNIHVWEESAMLKNPDGSYGPNPEFVGKNLIPYVWNNLYGDQDRTYKMANAGYDVIMCPVSNFYFDLAYDKDPQEPGLYWAGFVRTRDAWSFAPYDIFKTTTHTAGGRKIDKEVEYAGMERLKPEARKHILGVEAQLWSETIKGREMIEYYMLPKLFGFAESAWAQERVWETIDNDEKREKVMDAHWNVFANTMAQKELPRLSYMNGGYNYRIPLPGAVIEDGKLLANIEFPGLELRYTTDGTEPTATSTLYVGPVDVSGEVKVKAFDASGKASRTSIAKAINLRDLG